MRAQLLLTSYTLQISRRSNSRVIAIFSSSVIKTPVYLLLVVMNSQDRLQAVLGFHVHARFRA